MVHGVFASGYIPISLFRVLPAPKRRTLCRTKGTTGRRFVLNPLITRRGGYRLSEKGGLSGEKCGLLLIVKYLPDFIGFFQTKVNITTDLT
jgi:hypothetical protein